MLNDKNIELLIKGAKEYNIILSEAQVDKFSKYASLLVEWNEKINLSKVFKSSVKSLIDVGTGAGFPGLPINIVKEDIKVTLFDSLQKRLKFLKEVSIALELKNIKMVHGRAEDFGINKMYREKFDIATARAVANLPVLLEYCLPFVKVGGIFIAMKGPDIKDEIINSKKALDVLGGKIEEVKQFVLPGSDNERNIVIVRKYRQTPTNFPRKSGKPTKAPIA